VALSVINKLMPGRYPALCSAEFGLSSPPLMAVEQLPNLIVLLLSIFLPFFVKKYFFRGSNISNEDEFYLPARFYFLLVWKLKEISDI